MPVGASAGDGGLPELAALLATEPCSAN